MWRNWNPLMFLMGMLKWYNCSVKVLTALKKLNIELSTASWYIPIRKACLHQYIQVFIATLVIAEKWKIKYWWISKLWYIHVIEYSWAIKSNEVPLYINYHIDESWKHGKRRNQKQKARYYRIPFTWSL